MKQLFLLHASGVVAGNEATFGSVDQSLFNTHSSGVYRRAHTDVFRLKNGEERKKLQKSCISKFLDSIPILCGYIKPYNGEKYDKRDRLLMTRCPPFF